MAKVVFINRKLLFHGMSLYKIGEMLCAVRIISRVWNMGKGKGRKQLKILEYEQEKDEEN